MLHPDDHAYYSRRAADELERGDQAVNATVAAVHYEFASRYSILAAKAGKVKPQLTLVDGGKRQLAA